MDIETCVDCGTEVNVWVFGRCTKCWLSRDEAPPTCDGCRYGYLNQKGHIGPGGCLEEDFLKTDSFILQTTEEPPTLSASSQMYLSRSRSPSPSPSSPCEKIYLCAHRNCHTIVEQPGSECGKCNKIPSWTQISDGHFCGFADCKECSVYPYSCKTCQCDNCGNLFSLKEDDSFTGSCYECKQLKCSLCEELKSDFDDYGVCLNCRTTSCTCGTCVRCENTRRLAAPKLCPCGEQSVSDLYLQCVDCYYDERTRRFSE